MDEKHPKQRIAVIGASGFIGRNIVDWARTTNQNNFLWVYFTTPLDKVSAVSFDNFLKARLFNECKSVICVAGNSDHSLADRDFLAAVIKDSSYLVELLNHGYAGSIILLSSAAVYYGYEGPVAEDVPIAPTIKYGISKYVAELLVRSHSRAHGVPCIIFRLMYSFGQHEKKRRLIPALCAAIQNATPFIASGNGNSFLNPLPASFVAEILGKTALKLGQLPFSDPVEIYNLSSPSVVRVRDIVESLRHNYSLDVVYVPEENQPVTFYTTTDKLAALAQLLGSQIPDPLTSIQTYVEALLGESCAL